MKKYITITILSTSLAFGAANYELQDLTGRDFSNQDLTSANFYYATATNANFTNANLSGGGFELAKLENVNFTNANLTSASFDYAATLTGSNFTDAKLVNANLNNFTATNSNFTNVDFTGASFNSRMDITGSIIKGANLGSSISNGFTLAHLQSTKSYATDKDLSGVWFDYNNISNWDLSGLNLQNTSYVATRITGVDVTNSDLRGAEMSVAIGAGNYKNTIMSDGVIKNVSLNSREDRLTIRKYTPATEGGEDIIAKISELDVIIDNDASIDFELGAQLKITNGKSLTVEYGNMNIDTDLDSSTKMYVDDGAGFYVTDDTVVDVNIIDEIEEGESYLISILEWSDGAIIDELLAQTVENAHIFLWINGKQYTGEWDAQINGNSFGIAFTAIPEPSTYAIIFGAIALGFVAYRRRK